LKQTIEAGKTLLVDGPACITIVTGKAEVFGYQLDEQQRTVVREGKRLPFFTLEKTDFEVSLGPKAAITEVNGCSVPDSWAQTAKTIMDMEKKPAVIMVVGKADSGKSSFTTYLSNKLTGAKHKIAVLDGDLGQSDIGAPCTVACSITSKPFTDPYDLRVFDAVFVGVTSPVQAIESTVQGLVSLEKEVLERPTPVEYVLINTDGWVSGQDALNFKLRLVGELKPDLIVAIQTKNELKDLLSAVANVPTVTVEASASVSERNPEKRKLMRELSYVKFMKGSKIHLVFMNYIEIKERKFIPKEPGEEFGVLIGLKSKRRFLGIGIISEANRLKRTLKVYTPVKIKPSAIIIGKVRLDAHLHEAKS
jgi:polynucleotide 5'-hydroxyl-kinase GRC3/NOL9